MESGATVRSQGNDKDASKDELIAPPEPTEIVYLECYDLYRSWALESIDIIKGELLSLCFPLFAHW